jgi:hypothetical protein
MKTRILMALLTATTAVTGLFLGAESASAFIIKGRSEAPVYIQDILPELKDFVGKEARYLAPEKIGAQTIDLNSIKLKYDHNVNVYFIGETAGGYRNQLDFITWKDGNILQNQTKIFGDTSCSKAEQKTLANYKEFCANPNDPLANKSQQDKPLNVGDFAELGNFKAGTVFDFRLVSNAINGGIYKKRVKGVFGVDEATNPDKLQHVMAYYYKDLMIFGYEDLWGGGDKDYNDVVFAIDFGKGNARDIPGVSVPEPSSAAALMGIAGLVGFGRRRRQGKSYVD